MTPQTLDFGQSAVATENHLAKSQISKSQNPSKPLSTFILATEESPSRLETDSSPAQR